MKAPKARAEGIDASQRRDYAFWKHDEPHRAVWDYSAQVGRRTRARRHQDVRLACLYDDAELAQVMLGGTSSLDFSQPLGLTTNIVKRTINTYVGKMVKNKPAPMALTVGGDFSQRQRARNLTKLFQGSLEASGWYRERRQKIRHSAVFGSGIALNYRIGTQIYHELTFPWEWRVDPHSARYGRPRTVILRRYMDVEQLKSLYKGRDGVIEKSVARDSDESYDLGFDELSDQRLVQMAWHLPSHPEADDGSYVVCVSEGTLDKRKYTRDYFPVDKLDFLPAISGWFGDGMAAELEPVQYEANAVGLKLQEAHYLSPSFIIAVEGNAAVETDRLDNLAANIVRYKGQAPQFITPQPAHPDLLSYYQMLRSNWGAEESGVSQLSQAAQKPAGLNSGKALRTMHDIESIRFMEQGQADQDSCLATAWQHYDLLEEAYGEDSGLRIKSESRKYGRTVVDELRWKDVRIDREKFVLRTWPVSMFSQDPTSKFEQVQEMMNAKLITSREEAMQLLDLPDTESMADLGLARRRNIERILERIAESEDPEADGVYIYPEPAMGLELCKELGITYSVQAQLDGAPEAVWRKMLEFATDAQTEITKATAPPPPPPAPPPPGPPDPNAPPPDGGVPPEMPPMPPMAA